MLREAIIAEVHVVLGALPALPIGKGAMILILGGVFVLASSLIWTLLTPAPRANAEPERPARQARSGYRRQSYRHPGAGRGTRPPVRETPWLERRPSRQPTYEFAAPPHERPWLQSIAPTPPAAAVLQADRSEWHVEVAHRGSLLAFEPLHPVDEPSHLSEYATGRGHARAYVMGVGTEGT